VLDAGLDPSWEGTIFGEKGAHCKVQGLSTVSCAKTAESIDMSFGLWTRVGRRKHKFNHIRQVTPMCPHGRAHWRQILHTCNTQGDHRKY